MEEAFHASSNPARKSLCHPPGSSGAVRMESNVDVAENYVIQETAIYPPDVL